MKSVCRWLLLLCLTVIGASATAEVYKWTDANGNVHFGDRPPQRGAEAVPMPDAASTAAPASPQERLERQRRLLRAFDEERRQRRDARAHAQQDATRRQRLCAEARDDLHNREVASGLYRLGPDGQRVFLSDEERVQATAEARAAVAQWCGKP